ncbi:DUF2259 domain-containing protein [Rhizobium sp.]
MKFFAGLLTVLLLLLTAGSASAGDTSSLDVLGYSPDGKVFGFEEYGIADGSGFPYSNIVFVDIAADKFLPGTPIRVRLEDETGLAKARETARAKAAALLEKYKLADNPGVILAFNPPSEVDSDPKRLRFQSFLSAPPAGFTNTLTLATKEFPVPADCASFAENYRGFTLKLTEYQGQPTDTIIHDEANVPASRACALDYSIGAVVSSEVRDVTMMAMILVNSHGFEGPDRRWIAVPITPPGP